MNGDTGENAKTAWGAVYLGRGKHVLLDKVMARLRFERRTGKLSSFCYSGQKAVVRQFGQAPKRPSADELRLSNLLRT